MKLSDTEKLNFAIIRGSKAYEEWDRRQNMPTYLTIILYELLMRQKLTQKDLVNLSDLPKQSINKGIHRLLEKDYLELTVDPDDNRVKYCQLTDIGKKYAQEKMASLFEIENRIAQKMGAKKMKQLVALNEEWSNTFWECLGKKGEK
ncbi:transcriptional regulator [Lactobacillus taiwanensis DSM 21401]|jgi:Transcriptional regulators|uniref:MarR family transcriptional regulator n=1 Tax=Lactobacillus taiwanensis TaxID=508451 RepID=A0A256LJ90_9LACO|nr:helix-turn-helix domain-containing protein [Lactobacillus taiwanensis]KRM99180.1 transcriptional regulator [Lactobacillus taiwanensis DSM 21401]MCR1916308.1 MarR family winged helix-turn-helix transcriptional regulator [Lactobacillus taiwanensis]OYR89152.1 MarR family transcriptional regulator [Lactobacillus taiwanensis]OYR92846.1 MarR family transcriptional regulator [Lactobacillus taiwanensis]OYR93474.1 MarR family transcriptional regulator [Lactobacillus taiwanensis]